MIDRPDDLDGLLLAHQPRNGRTDRADTILDGANFLFHVVLRLRLAGSAHRAFLLANETPTIKEFASPGNANPAAVVSFRLRDAI